ncbi:g4011 [Coccomyxa viridis]|uniref:G4011 protein n=1 Tax=Coccomyxa viridis TaxID=1274662 RepID=A0ABP1FU84_9CHLO
MLSGHAQAADFVKTGLCLAQNCKAELANCLADGQCRENLICLQNCNGREDESQCQIRCGDLYAGKVVEEFNSCAITKHNCVAARVDVNKYPEPPPESLVKSFDINDFTGQWNITAGQNDLFDTFDCQKHYFKVSEPGTLYGEINWRVRKNNGDFVERHAVQTFKQNKDRPGYLRNDGNDFLSYTDDWYILGWKPDVYAVIYYKGNNDAWKGYGGATVYTRAESLPEELVPEMTEAIEKVGLNWKDFKRVNNSCPPHPEESLVSNVVGGLKDINPTEVKPQESPVDIGQGPKFSYMDSDKSSKVEKPAAVGNKDNQGGLTPIGPK